MVVKRVLWIFMLFLIAGCTKAMYPPSKHAMQDAVRMTIVPDPSFANKYRLECENCDTPAGALVVHPGDWIAWTHTFPDDDPLILEFSTAGMPPEKLATAAALFGLANPNMIVAVAVHSGEWTWLRVGSHAAEGRHKYGVHGMAYGDPTPGLIVCPPGQTCP